MPCKESFQANILFESIKQGGNIGEGWGVLGHEYKFGLNLRREDAAGGSIFAFIRSWKVDFAAFKK